MRRTRTPSSIAPSSGIRWLPSAASHGLAPLLSLLVAACEPSPVPVDDADGDGVPAGQDCDDSDPGSTAVWEDSDCDGALALDDCDDADPSRWALSDCWGVVEIPPGAFVMGCLEGRDDLVGPCEPDEMPAHEVTLTHPFAVLRTEITQAQWLTLMDDDPSEWVGCGGDCPVGGLNWDGAMAFADLLSVAEDRAPCDVSGNPYECEGWRLPTEAEWEYAARAGGDQIFAGSGTADDVAWYEANSGGTPHPVCTKAPNAFGLCDMSGNIYELTLDVYAWDYYQSSPATDPTGAEEGPCRTERGGSALSLELRVRSSGRRYFAPGYRYDPDLGFRLVRSL